jgi:TonB family protein
MRISGEVRLAVTVDPEGKVADVKKVSGNTMLSDAAVDAVRKWRFAPGADTATVDVTLNFALTQ